VVTLPRKILVSLRGISNLAKKLGNAHENWIGNPPLEKEMDLFNNQVGYEQYLYLHNLNLSGHFYNDALIIKLLDLVEKGGLKRIKDGKLVPTP
jgi:hypothetical protein